MEPDWRPNYGSPPGYYSPGDTPDFSMPSSQPESRSGSPERRSRPRKRVDWRLPDERPHSEDVSPHTNHRKDDDDDEVKHNLVDEATGEPLGQQISNTELRRELKRIFSSSALPNQRYIGEGPSNNHGSPPSNDTPPHPSDEPSEGSSGATRRPTRGPSAKPRPKSVLRKGDATPPIFETPPEDDVEDSGGRKSRSAVDAQKRAVRMAETLDEEPEPSLSRHSSVAGNLFTSSKKEKAKSSRRIKDTFDLYHEGDALKSGQVTPEGEDNEGDYVERPDQWRVSGLSAIHLLNKLKEVGSHSRRSSLEDGLDSRASSPARSSRSSFLSAKGSKASPFSSSTSLADLIQSSSAHLGSIAGSGVGKDLIGRAEEGRSERAKRPPNSRMSSAGIIESVKKPWRNPREDEVRIKRHVQQTVFRQRYLLKLCRALMEYGAPSHRLEEYMKMSARVLETEAQFLYIPGCMIISFDDSRTHTTEVRLVRISQGVDLGKLRDTHDVYKDVVHDLVGVEEATERLVEVINRKPKFSKWWDVFMFGLASASVAPFAFYARWIDLPFCFFLGSLLGFLRIIVAPASELYTNIFEIFAVILTSFLARAFGSIRGGDLFCFSTMAQSSLALILPGYTVLRASLELQSKSLVAGSVNLVYAIVFSLFIGFALAIGSLIYGAMDRNATSATICPNPMSSNWYFLFVPIFSFCLSFVNKAKWRQMPVMIIIAFVGWMISFFSGKRFSSSLQITNTLAALGIGVMANLYSRLGRRLDPVFNKLCDKGNRILRRTTLKILRKMPTVRRSSNAPTPSTLEKQVSPSEEEDSEATKKRQSYFRRYLRILHNMIVGSHRSPSKEEERSSSTASSTGSSIEDADSPAAKAAAKKAEKRKRINYSLAASAMLPAIFVQVPSGLSVSGSLVAGIQSANQIAGNVTTGVDTVSSGQVLQDGSRGSSGDVMFGVAYSVVQVSIGITIGLYLGTLVMYPTGKGGVWSKGMRSGIFSF